MSVLVSENLVSEKKSRYRLWSKFWYRHSVDLRRGNDDTMLYLISLFKAALICLYRVIYLFCVRFVMCEDAEFT